VTAAHRPALGSRITSMTRSIGGTCPVRVLHHSCGYAWRNFRRDAPSVAKEVEPHFLQMARELTTRMSASSHPNAVWPRRKNRVGQQALEDNAGKRARDAKLDIDKESFKTEVGDTLISDEELKTSSAKGAEKSRRVLALQMSDASTVATLEGAKVKGKRPGRRARARQHMEDYMKSVHGGPGIGEERSITLSAEALCSILECEDEEETCEFLLAGGAPSTTAPSTTACEGHSDSIFNAVEAIYARVVESENEQDAQELRRNIEVEAAKSDKCGIDDGELPEALSTTPLHPASQCERTRTISSTDSDSSQVGWAGVDWTNLDEEDADYLLRVPPMPEEGVEIWEMIPRDAINILQRFCFFCRPRPSDHIRLMINIIEAMIATLWQPCRPSYNHMDRAWDIGLAVDLAETYGACLAAEDALKGTWEVLHRLLTSLGEVAARFRNEGGGDPREMTSYGRKLEKCQICIHLWKKRVEDGESSEDPEIQDILDTLQNRSGRGPASGLSNESLQAALQARLQASLRN